MDMAALALRLLIQPLTNLEGCDGDQETDVRRFHRGDTDDDASGWRVTFKNATVGALMSVNVRAHAVCASVQ
jgi:hypothetical protein